MFGSLHVIPRRDDTYRDFSEERFETCHSSLRLNMRLLVRSFQNSGKPSYLGFIAGPRHSGKLTFVKQAWKQAGGRDIDVRVVDSTFLSSTSIQPPALGRLLILRRCDTFQMQQQVVDILHQWSQQKKEWGYVVVTCQTPHEPLKSLSSHQVSIPPLRYRREDIGYLSADIISRFPPLSFQVSAREALLRNPWLGEYPELANCVVFCAWRAKLRGDVWITLEDLKTFQQRLLPIDYWLHIDLLSGRYEKKIESDGLRPVLSEIEALLIAKTLDQFDGKLTPTARHLKLPISTLADRVKKFSLRDPL